MGEKEGLPVKICILVLAVVFLVVGVTACGKPSSTTTSGATYKLTHNLEDLEYIISWDTIAARIPDMNDPAKYDKFEAHVARRNAGGFVSLDSNSPAMWLCARSVTMRPEGNRFRSFGVWMWFFETRCQLGIEKNQAGAIALEQYNMLAYCIG
jgi:hypothetical protein